VALSFADGSVASILYSSGGATSVGKEYVEAHSAGRSAILDDFRSLRLAGVGRTRRSSLRSRDKGHYAQLVAFRKALDGDDSAYEPPDPLVTMGVTLAALRAAAGRD
jgi:hypothetical protein